MKGKGKSRRAPRASGVQHARSGASGYQSLPDEADSGPDQGGASTSADYVPPSADAHGWPQPPPAARPPTPVVAPAPKQKPQPSRIPRPVRRTAPPPRAQTPPITPPPYADPKYLQPRYPTRDDSPPSFSGPPARGGYRTRGMPRRPNQGRRNQRSDPYGAEHERSGDVRGNEYIKSDLPRGGAPRGAPPGRGRGFSRRGGGPSTRQRRQPVVDDNGDRIPFDNLPETDKARIRSERSKRRADQKKKPHIPTATEAKDILSGELHFKGKPEQSRWNFHLQLKSADDNNLRQNYTTGYLVMPYLNHDGSTSVYSVTFSKEAPKTTTIFDGNLREAMSKKNYFSLSVIHDYNDRERTEFFANFVAIKFAQRHLKNYVPISDYDFSRACKLFGTRHFDMAPDDDGLEYDDFQEQSGSEVDASASVATLMSKLSVVARPTIVSERSKPTSGRVRYYVVFSTGEVAVGNGALASNIEGEPEVRTNHHVFKDSKIMTVFRVIGNDRALRLLRRPVSDLDVRVDQDNDLVSIRLGGEKSFDKLPTYAAKDDIASIDCIVRASVSGVKIDAVCKTTSEGTFEMKAEPGYSGSGIIFQSEGREYVIGLAKSYVEGSDSVGVILFTEDAYKVKTF